MGDNFKNIKGGIIFNRSTIEINASGDKNSVNSNSIDQKKVLQFKELIAVNRLPELINQLKQYFIESDEKKSLNSIIIFESRLNLIDEQQRLGLTSNDEHQVELNKLKNGLLEIIDNL